MRLFILVAATLIGFSLPVPASPLPDSPAAPEPKGQPLDQDTSSRPVLLPYTTRGQLLYENHCTGCHESIVHIRSRRLARSMATLRMQVVRWAAISKLRWNALDIEEVVTYLNNQHYHLDR